MNFPDYIQNLNSSLKTRPGDWNVSYFGKNLLLVAIDRPVPYLRWYFPDSETSCWKKRLIKNSKLIVLTINLRHKPSELVNTRSTFFTQNSCTRKITQGGWCYILKVEVLVIGFTIVSRALVCFCWTARCCNSEDNFPGLIVNSTISDKFNYAKC